MTTSPLLSRPKPVKAPGPASSRQTRGVNHAELVKSVRKYLKERGAYEFKVLGGIGQRSGIGDVVACLRGRYVMCEVKTGTATMTNNQIRENLAVEQAGGLFIEVRSIEQLENTLLAAGLLESPALLRFGGE